MSGFAKHWARALAFGPILCLVTLHARVVQDGAMADGDGDISWPIAIVFITGLAFIVMGVRLLLRHGDTPENDPSRYYSGLSWHDWCCAIGFWPEEDRSRVNVKYRVLFERLRVYFLPVLLGPAMFACRFFDVLPPDWPWQQDHVPSLALATVLFAVALWLCFFGWLSMLEVHQSVPWIGLLIVAAGFFGAKGWADNHVVWTDLASEPHASRWASLHMLLYTGALLLLVLVAYWLAIQIARARSRQTPAPHRRLAWGLGGPSTRRRARAAPAPGRRGRGVLGSAGAGHRSRAGWHPLPPGLAPVPARHRRYAETGGRVRASTRRHARCRATSLIPSAFRAQSPEPGAPAPAVAQRLAGGVSMTVDVFPKT